MQTVTLLTAIGVTLALGTPSIVQAQTQQPQPTRRAVTRGAKPIASERPQTKSIRRSGLPPGFLDQNDGGNHFTDSTMRSVTRAGTLGVETGTFGSDTNGQIGTTNQNGMVHFPLSYSGVFIYHFGSGAESKPAPLKAHRSPKAKPAAQDTP